MRGSKMTATLESRDVPVGGWRVDVSGVVKSVIGPVRLVTPLLSQPINRPPTEGGKPAVKKKVLLYLWLVIPWSFSFLASYRGQVPDEPIMYTRKMVARTDHYLFASTRSGSAVGVSGVGMCMMRLFCYHPVAITDTLQRGRPNGRSLRQCHNRIPGPYQMAAEDERPRRGFPTFRRRDASWADELLTVGSWQMQEMPGSEDQMYWYPALPAVPEEGPFMLLRGRDGEGRGVEKASRRPLLHITAIAC